MVAQEVSAWFVVANVVGLALSLRWSRVLAAIFGAAALFSLSPFCLIPGIHHDMARQ
jgi:hypothetical protein